jgi:hypothetical protein
LLVYIIVHFQACLGELLPTFPSYSKRIIWILKNYACLQSRRAASLLVWNYWVLSYLIRSRTAEMGWSPDNSTPRGFDKGGQDSIDQEQCPGLVPNIGVVSAATRNPNTEDGSPSIKENIRIFKAHNGQTDKEEHDIRNPTRVLAPPRINGPQSSQENNIEGNPMIATILNSAAATRHFWHATLAPPITKHSLSELDISSIINNSKLRHDVNFDRDLHFRPNLDGHKGQLKREAQRDYWEAVTAELQLYRSTCGSFTSDPNINGLRKDCQRRIPHMFVTIKEILKHLVPERDQPSVDEHLDVLMVMQEIEKGVCDFASIVAWLAQLLKRHCAPMRDEMVDRMVEKVRKGDDTSMSAGLCELFGVLEAMKLVSR